MSSRGFQGPVPPPASGPAAQGRWLERGATAANAIVIPIGFAAACRAAVHGRVPRDNVDSVLSSLPPFHECES